MSLMSIPPEEKAYQLANPNETSVHGLIAWCIAGLCIVEVAFILRCWSRSIQKVPWRSDDWTLLVAAILVVGHCVCVVLNIQNGFGHHTLTVTKDQSRTRGRVGYAYNFIYNTTFPISRIALVLLYKRIFNVKLWFQYACWVIIGLYVGYMLAWIPTVAVGVRPIAANWDKTIPVEHTIDFRKLQLANCSFNIATDALLLILPLLVIWTLQMSPIHKLGVSSIFCLGVLTVIASIMRCYYTFHANNFDPLFDQGRTGYWTTAEVYLGILCPCLVTFRPLLGGGYKFFSSNLSRRNRNRVAKLTGIDISDGSGGSSGNKLSNLSSSKPQRDGFAVVDEAEQSKDDLEAQKDMGGAGYADTNGNGTKHSKWYNRYSSPKRRRSDGMAQNQEVALANLDPRVQAEEDAAKGRVKMFGSSAHATAEHKKGGFSGAEQRPNGGITVNQDWDLHSTKAEV